jgi:hypothetical protein
MGRPSGNDRGEAYWRSGREHASGYQSNEDARANWEQGYREETVEENRGQPHAPPSSYPDDETHFDERSWSPYAASHAPPRPEQTRPEQTREGSGMQRGSWRGQGWGAEVYRGGVGTGNYESPYMRERSTSGSEAYADRGERTLGRHHYDYGEPRTTRGYGGQPRGMPPPLPPMPRGPHAGKGPKGYKRSDERIREDVCERLTDHHEVDASEIEVSVEAGEVTLKGMVSARRDKLMAEHIAEGVSGVIDIHNQIRVRREGGELVAAPPAPKRDTTKS